MADSQYSRVQWRTFLDFIFAITILVQGVAFAGEPVAGSAIASTSNHGASQEFPKHAAAFFALLKARDEKFDNLSLEVEESWTDKIDPATKVAKMEFNNARFGGGKLPDFPDPLPEPYEQYHRVKYQLIVRGAEATLVGGDELEKLAHPEFGFRVSPKLKWTDVGGTEVAYSESFDGKDSTLHSRGAASPDSVLQNHRKMIGLSLGYGFAKHMDQFDEYRVEAERAVCSGPFHLTSTINVPCKLEIDSTLIVRKATIRLNSRGSQIEVSSEGIEHPDGIPAIASKGHYLRNITPPTNPNGEVHSYTDENKTYRFVKAIPDLSDGQYAELTRIEARADTAIIEPGNSKVQRLGHPAVTPKR